MDKEEIIRKTAEFVKQKMQGEGTGHDWWHVYRVWRTALRIGKEEKADLFIVQLGALLHDIADFKFHGGDFSAGERVTRKWLSSIEVDETTTNHVAEIVKNVSFKGAKVKSGITTKEGMVVQDADRLDAMGAVGVARAFAYGGFTQRELYNPDEKPVLHTSAEDYKNSKSHTINHFYEKLLLLKGLMNTKTGKKLAMKRHNFMLKYLSEFYKEWEGKG
ncbi:HD domain-containing protein [Candidatus Woesearchaeota archaeon]|nr:HD domain-containing protein [Candidatus Woesearchaeota archaeon]